MSPEAQSLTDQIRAMAQGKGQTPLEFLRALVDRERKEREARLSRHERKLQLVRA